MPKEVMKNRCMAKMDKGKPMKGIQNRKAIKKAKLRNIVSYHHKRIQFSKFKDSKDNRALSKIKCSPFLLFVSLTCSTNSNHIC